MNELNLNEADKVEVVVLVDNYTDTLMESTHNAKRPPISPPRTPLAEHGLSCLVKVFSGAEERHVLLDTGHSSICITHNMDLLKIDAKKIEYVVISHGHVDHIEGLMAVLQRTGKQVSVVLHPEAFLERRLNPPSGHIVNIPGLNQKALQEAGVNLIMDKKPSAIASGFVLVTSTVERVTAFEKGFPLAEAKIEGQWVVDPFNDDQALAVKVKGKGLVVIGGCSHAGIINTVKYCQKLTGSGKIHAILGGFHLNGKIFEPILGPTIGEMKKLRPEYVVPMHCTGWTAMNEFAREMPKQFVLNSVGTTYTF